MPILMRFYLSMLAAIALPLHNSVAQTHYNVMVPVCAEISGTAKRVRKQDIAQLKEIDRKNIEKAVQEGVSLSEEFLVISAYDYKGDAIGQATTVFPDADCTEECMGVISSTDQAGPQLIPIRHNGKMVKEVYVASDGKPLSEYLTYIFLSADQAKLVSIITLGQDSSSKQTSKLIVSDENHKTLYYGSSFKNKFYKGCLIGKAS